MNRLHTLTFMGVDQRMSPAPDTCSLLTNVRLHPDGYFVNDCGWEPFDWWDDEAGTPDVLFPQLQPCRSLFAWTKGREHYFIRERGGFLYYRYGNKGAVAGNWAGHILLGANRHQPGPNEVGTQYVPFGDFLLIFNGVDQPIKFWGGREVTPFGLSGKPSAPTLLGVSPSSYYGGTLLEAGMTGVIALNDTTEYGAPGLGDIDITAAENENSYEFAVAFVTDSGAIGPISGRSRVSWSDSKPTGVRYRFGVVGTYPTGPSNVIARQVFRTKNLKNEEADGTLYFERQVDDNVCPSWTTMRGDADLVVSAPSSADSVELPFNPRIGASWGGRLWIASGSKLAWSARGEPERFELANIVDMGASSGGNITGLHPYRGELLVFREQGISAVVVDGAGGFAFPEISTAIGTEATNTITTVPGHGVLFLGAYLVYRLTGSFQGGDAYQITPISQPVTKAMRRLSLSLVARACAAYSPREREWWCHFPADGASEATRGVVLHTDTGAWSLRHIDGTDHWLMAVTQLSVTGSGHFLMGNAPYDTLSKTIPGTLLSTDDATIEAGSWSNIGLQMWGQAERWSLVFSGGDGGQGGGQEYSTYSFDTVTDKTRAVSTWETQWEQPSAERTAVKSVVVHLAFTGSNPIELSWAKDWDEGDFTSAGTKRPEPYEKYNSRFAAPVLSSLAIAATKGFEAVFNTSTASNRRRGQVRWDIDAQSGLHWKFRIQSASTFAVLGVDLVYRDNAKTTGQQAL